jgi:hypothetical protein
MVTQDTGRIPATSYKQKTEGEIKNGQSKDTDNMVTQDTGRIPATSYKQRKLKGKSRMDNPKTLTTWSHKTQDEYQQHHINRGN